MIIDAVNNQRLEIRAVLRSRLDLGGKLSAVERAATRTIFGQETMLGDFKLEWRQIKDLPPVVSFSARRPTQVVAAAGASRGAVMNDSIRRRRGLERSARMPLLSARLLAAWRARGFWALRWVITRRRFAAVTRVERQTVLQVFDSRVQ